MLSITITDCCRSHKRFESVDMLMLYMDDVANP